MKFNAWKFNIKLFNWSWIMAFIDTLHIIIILALKVNSSGILTCSLSGLIFISFSFGVYLFLSHLIILLGLFTLFYFLLFFIFQNMGKQLAESKVCTYLQDYHSQFKNYESYYYRTLTSLWKKIENLTTRKMYECVRPITISYIS